MKDTGFIGIRMTQFPQILKTYNITAPDLQKEANQARLPHHHHLLQRPDARPRAARRGDRQREDRHDLSQGVRREPPGGVLAQSHQCVARPRFKTMCECFNEIGEVANEMGFRAGLHNHMGQIVQTAEEVDRCMAMTDPKLFHFSPDTAHLHLAECDVVKTLEKHKSRLMLLDYKDANRKTSRQVPQQYLRPGRRRNRLSRAAIAC